MKDFETRKIQEILEMLTKEKVMVKRSDNSYLPSDLFDFVFRGHLAIQLFYEEDPTKFEGQITEAIVETLDHFNLTENRNALEISFLTRVIRTFVSEKTIHHFMELIAK